MNSDLLSIKNLSIFLCTCVVVALRHSRPKVAEIDQMLIEGEEQNWTVSDRTRVPPVKTNGRQHRGNDQSRIGGAGRNQMAQCVLGTKLTFGCVQCLQTRRPPSIKNHIDFLEATGFVRKTSASIGKKKSASENLASSKAFWRRPMMYSNLGTFDNWQSDRIQWQWLHSFDCP